MRVSALCLPDALEYDAVMSGSPGEDDFDDPVSDDDDLDDEDWEDLEEPDELEFDDKDDEVDLGLWIAGDDEEEESAW
jgi:hypothetical protein